MWPAEEVAIWGSGLEKDETWMGNSHVWDVKIFWVMEH
jgi:hypothetical protein